MREITVCRLVAANAPGAKQKELMRISKAFDILPPDIKRAAVFMSDENKSALEEIRLRNGWPVCVLIGQTEYVLARDGRICGRDGAQRGFQVSSEYVAQTVERAANGVIYGAQESIKDGYITVSGGHRVGICGHAVTEKNRVNALKHFSSVCVRIARALVGIGTETAGFIAQRSGLHSTLIISPPLRGKTTLLRDIVRELSYRDYRIGLADERGELAGMVKGTPQFDVGPCTDVIDGCPKSEGALMLLRGMSPDLIAMDEITAPEDVEAICKAANCGVAVLASAHADGICELKKRKTYGPLFESGIFGRIASLDIRDGERFCTLYDVDES